MRREHEETVHNHTRPRDIEKGEDKGNKGRQKIFFAGGRIFASIRRRQGEGEIKMDIKALVEKRANLWKQAQDFLDTHEAEGKELSAEDKATYDKMVADVQALTDSIKRREHLAKIGEELDKTVNPSQRFEQPGAFLGGNDGKSGRASDEYKRDFLQAMRTNFKQVSNFLQENNPVKGGYLVPTEMDSRLIDVLEEENVMRKLGTVIKTASEHKITLTANKPAAAWLDEGEKITFSEATFGQVVLDAHKLGVGVQISEELLFDNVFNLETYIAEEFGKALANAEENAFLNGEANANKPTGILTSIAADMTAFNETTGANISSDDIINLVYSLKRPYRKKAVFLLNDATLAIIRKLKDANQAYMWQESLQAEEPSRLLGYPVYTTPFMPTAASGNFALVFGDISYYNIGDRNSRWIQEMKEAYADEGLVGYIMKERVDGKLTLTDAVRALKIK